MRNLFDQYDQPENRLSHALAVSLYEDRALLRRFIDWIDVKPPERAKALVIVEQSLPGDVPQSEEQAERKGLPDIVIHDDAAWCLLIESKVQAVLTDDQLARHERTLRRRGFESVTCVALTKTEARSPRAVARTWSGLYEWLGKNGARSEWSERLRSYLRVAEVRLAQEGYLTEGTLTMFDGFQFSAENPYSYGEAKRLLKLALAELRKDSALRALGMDPKAQGRPAITGRSGSAVWDFLSLADRPTRGSFTSYPHLTLAVHDDHLEVAITIPNGVIRAVRRRLIDLGAEGLIELNAQILKRARRILSLGGRFEAYALQRHYVSQRSQATIDARMTFDLQTSQPRGVGRVKRQAEWVSLFAELLRVKRANIQFGYWVSLPWGTKGLDSRDSLNLIAESWCAMEPLIDRVRGKS
jgi:hypothetical protein